MLQNIIKVSCYGESLKIYDLRFDEKHSEQFYSVAKRLNQPLENALLDIRFFELLKLEKYQCIYDLVSDNFGGLIHNLKSKIEIKNGRKRLQQFSMQDLTSQQALFPLFNVESRISKLMFNDGLFLIEQEVGMISEYSIETNRISIDDITFYIDNLNFQDVNYSLLSEIHYKGTPLKSLKSDSLITYRYCKYQVPEKAKTTFVF